MNAIAFAIIIASLHLMPRPARGPDQVWGAMLYLVSIIGFFVAATRGN